MATTSGITTHDGDHTRERSALLWRVHCCTKSLELRKRSNSGRAHTKETKLTIAAVAREAGVSAGLIHNHHPAIAETIREAQGRSSRAQRDATHQKLKAEQEKNRELRGENETLRAESARLASINKVLQMENCDLKAQRDNSKVVYLGVNKSQE